LIQTRAIISIADNDKQQIDVCKGCNRIIGIRWFKWTYHDYVDYNKPDGATSCKGGSHMIMRYDIERT
jgi:hypothetical protein